MYYDYLSQEAKDYHSPLGRSCASHNLQTLFRRTGSALFDDHGFNNNLNNNDNIDNVDIRSAFNNNDGILPGLDSHNIFSLQFMIHVPSWGDPLFVQLGSFKVGFSIGPPSLT